MKTTDYEIEGLKVSLPLRVAQYRYQYPGQFRHQSAYIELDPSDKTLRCDWNGEIGNAVPFSVYHGRVLRFSFPPFSKLNDVRDTMKAIAPACAKLVASYDEKWDGNNWRGQWDEKILDTVQRRVWALSPEVY